ncbi:MAG: methyltransferase domain-containing protein [Alphaproteobacteria bacterium]
MSPSPATKAPRWDPVLYGQFAAERERPARDLIGRISLSSPASIVDLGCGPGNVTLGLAQRWPDARITGVDNAPQMLAEARGLRAHPDGSPLAGRFQGSVDWVEADIATWAPDQPPDLVFSNAALQWLGSHATLFPRLFAALAPGGVLAVQMPANHDAPSHRLMADCARQGPWADRLVPLLRPDPVAPAAFYYDLLAPRAAGIDIWETEYLQVLAGEDPVVAFVRGTGLKPLCDALAEPERGAFLAFYAERIRAAYPRRADGCTLFPFRRLFIVARGRGA